MSHDMMRTEAYSELVSTLAPAVPIEVASKSGLVLPGPSLTTRPSTSPESSSLLSGLTERRRRPVPGPLDLSSGNRRAAKRNALATARIIEDLDVVPYPEAIKIPNPDLNINARPGKVRYDRDFLLQFMNVCKQRPDSLPPLDVIGLEPGEQGAAGGYPSGARRGGRRVGSMGMSGPPSLQRQGSIGLGLGNDPSLAKGGAFSMGSFQAPSSRLRDNQSRIEASSGGARGVYVPLPPGPTSGLTSMTRSANQGGTGGSRKTRHMASQHNGLHESVFQTSRHTCFSQLGNTTPMLIVAVG
ncbi:hypothetical protein FRC09_000734 [Ceratobasidium sp. 395]|nr:hypothetical protein FRC09_000734 [Ceratobasidium sp. 395]